MIVVKFVLVLAAFVMHPFAAPEALPAPSGVPGRLYMQGRHVEGSDVILARYNDRRIRIFDRQVAYRNDRKACVRFELPAELPWPGTPLRIELEAYNDDHSYLRAIWLEVDGIGGYLTVQQVAEGQYRGTGTISPGERKSWMLPLDRLPISLKGKTNAVVDLDVVLRQPGPHTICAWISTYAEYGPKSWITLDIVGSPQQPESRQETKDTASAATSGGAVHGNLRKSADPCSGRTCLITDRNLRLALKQNPDTLDRYDQPVYGMLEISAFVEGEPATVLYRFDLNAGAPKVPGFYLDYDFEHYLSRVGRVVIKRAKAFRLYDIANHRVSALITPRECIGEDGRSFNIQRLLPLDDERFVYGEAVSCHPFLIGSTSPNEHFAYLESIGKYVLFHDNADGFLAADPESASLYRLSARDGKDARFALTYFLNQRGMDAYRKKDFVQAVKWFDRAAAVTPEDYLYPHTNLAGSLALAGMREPALERLRWACSLDQSFTRKRMLGDDDFAGLRQSSQFRELLQGICSEN